MLLSSSSLLKHGRRAVVRGSASFAAAVLRRQGTANPSTAPSLFFHRAARSLLKRTIRQRPRAAAGAGLFAICCGVGQHYYGNQRDFYDYRFTTDKDPDDLAGFYGGEGFMELFCVLPFMGTLMMRGGRFDDEGTIHTTGFPVGEMQVSMVFSDEEDVATNQTKWFNKRERFKNVFLGYTCWDMVTNFGFERLPDGRVMVYHHGEYFRGSFVPFSLLVRFVFGVHARWVAWAAEHHINHYAFTEEEGEEEEWEEESRADMPLFLLRNYAWSDLMSGLFGRKIEKPSFMLKRKPAEDAGASPEQAYELESDESEELPRLPTKRSHIQRRMTADIALDRKNSKLRLFEFTGDDGGLSPPVDEGKAIAIRSGIALDRRMTTVSHQDIDEASAGEALKDATVTRRRSSLTRENLGGPVAWEMLRSTNNPEAYVAVTNAARQRHSLRRQSRRRSKSGSSSSSGFRPDAEEHRD